MGAALDELWFERYHAIAGRVGETYELLLPRTEILEARLREFEASGYAAPVPLYSDRADSSQIAQAREELARLKEDVVTNESDTLIRDAYVDSITAVDHNAAMIIAGTEHDDRTFERTNAVLYEKPNEEVFKAVCHWIRHDATQSLSSSDSQLAGLAAKVLGVVPDLHDNHQLLIPSEKIFHDVRQAHRRNGGYYDKLFGAQGMPTDPYIDEYLGDEICERMLRNIGSYFTMAPSDNNIWAVFPSRSEVVRPAGYRLDRDEFIGIVCHEIGSHVLEYELGKQQAVKLLCIGLAGYEKSDEGRAFLREQIVYENERTFLMQFAWEYIVLLHLSVSLASGSNGRPYDLPTLYDTIYTLYLFWRERRQPRSTNNEAFARNETWQLVARVMKGTDGTGGAYMKDTIYLEGNIKCWQAAAQDPDSIFLGDLGKLDITNPKHMELLQKALAAS